MPNKDRNIPKRRFKEFENADAWELRKLVNEVLFVGTGKSKFSALEFGEFEILGSTSVIGYDNSYDYEGDFILTARVGANAGELYRHSGKVKISDNTVFIQGDGLDFIFYILQHFDIKKLSFGTGQPLVKASELKELKILMPVSVKERKHVGTFFSTLDRHITLHQRKLDKLKSVKQAYLSEMFPAEGERVPKRRFPRFTDAWELRKLGEISTHRSGTAIENHFSEDGKYKVISIGSYGLDNKYIDQKIRAVENEVTRSKVVNKNELTMVLNDKTANGNIIGRCLLIEADDEFVINQRTEIISFNSVIYPKFAYVVLNGAFREQVKKIVQGGTQIYVNYSSVEKLYLSLPTLAEQEAIGTFFSTLDQHITLHQRKLEKLKNLKKALLNELFV
ncbi:restriction endonuclease subunit S [Streptococcus parasuis]|uniref:restriction endonuclease subunit S n=1 Tax=Streptococcus parasuis TaxID=1501662 RepID=UPI002378ABCA|nr:restriction endonuclease subunit S [Streptococcus parasuis]WDN58103.1 restriction endonuclease subunit S [Streptococcus parasuis]